MIRTVISFFDRLEDRIRGALSRRPIIYALVGGVGVILFWKGVWETAETVPLLHGPASILVGVLIMLISGLLVSFFIGDSIIISGLNREKKLVERAAAEVRGEERTTKEMAVRLAMIEERLAAIEDAEAAERSR